MLSKNLIIFIGKQLRNSYFLEKTLQQVGLKLYEGIFTCQKFYLYIFLTFTGPHAPHLLLVFSAGPVNISIWQRDDQVQAIIQAFFPAQATGDALFNTITMATDDASPAGRLPYTWYDTVEQVYVNFMYINCCDILIAYRRLYFKKAFIQCKCQASGL